MHANTACHTHDLLDCPCDREQVNEPANSICSDGSDSEEERPAKFISASQVRPGKADKAVSFTRFSSIDEGFTSRQYLKKQKAALAALGQWRHINCLKPGAKDLIKDDLLHRLLYTQDRAPMTFSTETRPRASTLLEAVDLDNVLAMPIDEADNLRDVPGGTLSFLFQKDSTIITENDEQGVEEDGADEEGEEGEDAVASDSSLDVMSE